MAPEMPGSSERFKDMADARQLTIVYTDNSFRVDRPEEDYGDKEALKKALMSDKYRALFGLGLERQEGKESPSLRFLRLLAESFVKDLMSQPDLEVAREWTEVTPSEEMSEKLLRSAPFAVGAPLYLPLSVRMNR